MIRIVFLVLLIYPCCVSASEIKIFQGDNEYSQLTKLIEDNRCRKAWDYSWDRTRDGSIAHRIALIATLNNFEIYPPIKSDIKGKKQFTEFFSSLLFYTDINRIEESETKKQVVFLRTVILGSFLDKDTISIYSEKGCLGSLPNSSCFRKDTWSWLVKNDDYWDEKFRSNYRIGIQPVCGGAK